MKSIIHDKSLRTCYLCALLNQDYTPRTILEEHHIFGGANRKKSEHYGLKVYLCPEHHRTSAEAVHREDKNDNKELLHEIGQAAFEIVYKEQNFINVFGKNYR